MGTSQDPIGADYYVNLEGQATMTASRKRQKLDQHVEVKKPVEERNQSLATISVGIGGSSVKIEYQSDASGTSIWGGLKPMAAHVRQNHEHAFNSDFTEAELQCLDLYAATSLLPYFVISIGNIRERKLKLDNAAFRIRSLVKSALRKIESGHCTIGSDEQAGPDEGQ